MVDEGKYIKKGKTQVKIQNMQNLSNNEAQKIYKNLLKNLVKDEDLLNILATEQNIEKLKHRIEINAEIISPSNEILATVQKFNTTLIQASNDIPSKMNITLEGSDRNDLAKYFYYMNWTNFDAKKEGQSTKVRGNIIFRKGK